MIVVALLAGRVTIIKLAMLPVELFRHLFLPTLLSPLLPVGAVIMAVEHVVTAETMVRVLLMMAVAIGFVAGLLVLLYLGTEVMFVVVTAIA